jgi:hypothetical protein
MSNDKKRWFNRHQRLSLVLINVVILVVIFILAEIILRFYITYNPGYYTSIKTTSHELTYPWGKVPINSDGFPDEEFKLGDKQRIGYFGDSVNFGVGAGYGNRISEVLERAYPQYDHWNFGGIGESLSSNEIENNLALAKKYKLSKVVYLFNLNDIMPDITDVNSDVPTIRKVQIFVWRYLDWLRGKSYVYTYFRTGIKNYLATRGIEAHGYEAAELFPSRNIDDIAQTAQRINKMNRVLKEVGIEFYLVVMPYEMQISDDAARTYSQLKFKWEEGFLGGSTQRLLMKDIDKNVNAFDAYYGFTDPDSPSELQKNAKAGEYFVYNRGDKMDWNHLTAKGNKAIADYLIQQNIFK